MDQPGILHELYPEAIGQSAKLRNVCYDIRGPVLEEAKRL